MPDAATTPRAHVSGVRVDDDGIRAVTDAEVVLDVLFDGRRIWSFWLQRDGRPDNGGHAVPWPPALRRFLHGSTRLSLVEHVTGAVVHDAEVRLGDPAGDVRIAVVNDRGLPLGIDKSLRLAQTFDTRSAEHVKPLLDAVEEVLEALGRAGIEAFPAYGTLLGAVREGRLIGHDSDADIGYVSEHTHPADVTLESFRLQRALTDMGYPVTRYSGAAFKVDVREADGSLRGLDVFGGFLFDGHLHLMGEIRTPFRREWIYPLGRCTLEGRELPAPADPDRFLTATYGPSWRVPDPAYKFGTPESTHRRLNGWFRGIRVARDKWDRAYSQPSPVPARLESSDFAAWVVRREHGVPPRVVDLGCGRGLDSLWFARRGASVTALDYVPRGAEAAAAAAVEEELDLDVRFFNLCETRSALAEGARVARLEGRKVLLARNLVEATDRRGRENLWRTCEMMLRGGGRLYLEMVVDPGVDDPFLGRNHVRAVRLRRMVRELETRGARIVSRRVVDVNSPDAGVGHRIGRLVVEWQR